MARKLLDDCFLHDKDRLKHHEVLEILSSRLSPVTPTEHIDIAEAAGRFPVHGHQAKRAVPAGDNAAVDGYAFSHASYLECGGSLQVADRIAAGHPSSRPVESGEAARIFTGALMPPGADTVAMQEDCDVDGTQLRVPLGLKPGANRRKAGEDVTPGTTLIAAGQRLRAPDLAALAAELHLDIKPVSPAQLEAAQPLTQSARSQTERGTGSVAEAAALAAAGPDSRLVSTRHISTDRLATCAVAIGGQT